MNSQTIEGKINRRSFLNRTAGMVTGAAALSSTALSYGRIAGANERISLPPVSALVRRWALTELSSPSTGSDQPLGSRSPHALHHAPAGVQTYARPASVHRGRTQQQSQLSSHAAPAPLVPQRN